MEINIDLGDQAIEPNILM